MVGRLFKSKLSRVGFHLWLLPITRGIEIFSERYIDIPHTLLCIALVKTKK